MRYARRFLTAASTDYLVLHLIHSRLCSGVRIGDCDDNSGSPWCLCDLGTQHFQTVSQGPDIGTAMGIERKQVSTEANHPLCCRLFIKLRRKSDH